MKVLAAMKGKAERKREEEIWKTVEKKEDLLGREKLSR